MRIIKHGNMPNRVQFKCKTCKCEFSEKGRLCKPFRYSGGSVEYSHSCPECGAYVKATIKEGKYIGEE